MLVNFPRAPDDWVLRIRELGADVSVAARRVAAGFPGVRADDPLEQLSR